MPKKKSSRKKELKKIDDEALTKVDAGALAVGPYDRYPTSMGGYYAPEIQRRGARSAAWSFGPGSRRRDPFGR